MLCVQGDSVEGFPELGMAPRERKNWKRVLSSVTLSVADEDELGVRASVS